MLQPDGPLRGLALVAEASPNGSFAQPQLSFTTDHSEATAIIGLGDDVPADASLTVSWYRLVGVDGREHLFTHKISVGPGGHALSQGLAEGGLAPGLYETVAMLGDRQVRTPWVVRAPGEAADTPAAPAFTLLSTGSQAQAGTPDWDLPSSGDTGWHDGVGPPPQGSPPAECTVDDILAGLSPMTELTASSWWLGPCPSQTLTATVSGPPVTLATAENASGPVSPLYGQTDVCELPGGSDLPGTVVRLEATGSATASTNYTLPDLGEVLTVGVESVPAAGSQVEAGDRIALQAIAMLIPPADGIEVLYLDDGNDLIASVGNASGSDAPVPCDLGRYIAQLLLEAGRSPPGYLVPEDPPPVIEICANAAGFDGTKAHDCIEFYTGEVWEGTVVWNSAPCTGSCLITYGIRLVVGPDGTAPATGTFVSCTNCAPPPPEIAFEFRRAGDSFTGLTAGDYAMRGSIPITGSTASGETTSSFPPFTYRYSWKLECKTCEG